MTQQWQPGKTYPPLGAALSFPGLHHLPQMTMEARGVGDLARSLRSWGTSGSAYWNLTEGPLHCLNCSPPYAMSFVMGGRRARPLLISYVGRRVLGRV